jgi:hypothetical protein
MLGRKSDFEPEAAPRQAVKGNGSPDNYRNGNEDDLPF